MSKTQPDGKVRRLLKLFAPSRHTRRTLLVVFLLPVLLLACLICVLMVIGPTSNETISDSEAIVLIIGFILLPFFAVLTILVAMREGRLPAKTLLWLLAAGLFLLSGLVISVMMLRDPTLEADVPAVFMLIVVGPVTLLITLSGVYGAARVVPLVRAVLQDENTRRVLGLIESRQAVRLPDLAEAAGLSPQETGLIVDELLNSGKLAGSLDLDRQWLYTATYLAEKQRQLLEWISLRGRLRLQELANLLKVSPEIIEDWIYELVQREQFNGYVNWSQRMVYAASAADIGQDSQCPTCGGQLGTGESGRIVCLYCGREKVLPLIMGR